MIIHWSENPKLGQGECQDVSKLDKTDPWIENVTCPLCLQRYIKTLWKHTLKTMETNFNLEKQLKTTSVIETCVSGSLLTTRPFLVE